MAAQAQKIPYGMVPYGRPVFKNGKRILWHGAWRGSTLSRYARQSVAPAAAEPVLALTPEPVQPAVAKDFAVLADPGDARASRMAKDFATVMSASGAPGRAIVGSTSPNGLGKVLKTDVADFAIVSLDSLLSSAKGDPEWIKRVPFVARLAPETLAVIAPREVKSISDLQGKTVSFGDLDSATSTGGRMLFSRLGVTANQTNEPLPEALDRLSAGKIDAVVVLGGDELPALSDFGSGWSLSHRARSVVADFGAGLRSGSRHRRPTGRILSARPIPSKRSPSRWRSSRSTPRPDRRARMGSGRVARVFFENYDGLLSDEHDFALARRQSRGRRLVADPILAPARGGSKLAGCEKAVGRRIARDVQGLGQVGGRFGQLAKRRGFGSTL